MWTCMWLVRCASPNTPGTVLLWVLALGEQGVGHMRNVYELPLGVLLDSSHAGAAVAGQAAPPCLCAAFLRHACIPLTG